MNNGCHHKNEENAHTNTEYIISLRSVNPIDYTNIEQPWNYQHLATLPSLIILYFSSYCFFKEKLRHLEQRPYSCRNQSASLGLHNTNADSWNNNRKKNNFLSHLRERWLQPSSANPSTLNRDKESNNVQNCFCVIASLHLESSVLRLVGLERAAYSGK